MTYEEFEKFGKDNYNKGGDVIVECWSKSDFEEYVSKFGKITKAEAKRMIARYYEEERTFQYEY